MKRHANRVCRSQRKGKIALNRTFIQVCVAMFPFAPTAFEFILQNTNGYICYVTAQLNTGARAHQSIKFKMTSDVLNVDSFLNFLILEYHKNIQCKIRIYKARKSGLLLLCSIDLSHTYAKSRK